MPTGYSRAQIALHWAIFLLVAGQYLLHEPIADAWEKIEEGQPFVFQPLIAVHVYAGLLVLVLAAWRIGLRLTRGAPPLPAREPALLRMLAHVVHLSLYALVLLMPVSGAIAWFGGYEPAAQTHEVMKTLLLALIVLHVLAVLVHQFVFRSDLMARMKRAG